METVTNSEFMECWLKFHYEFRPGWLHHYTTADGLLGIVRSKAIFGTHYQFLNDSLELVWGTEVVARHIREYIANAEDHVKEALQQFEGAKIEEHWDVYVTCFCTEDNLLSQWRAYGRSGGYALAFRQLDLIGLCQARERCLRKVIYEHSEHDRWIRLALDWFVQQAKAIILIKDPFAAESARQEIVNVMWRAICEMCISFKLDVFKEESEWRAIEFLPRNETNGVNFRSKAGILVPYRSFPIEQRQDEKILRALDHVTCGPTLSREDVKWSVILLLRSQGFSDVWVNNSMIPLNAALE
jgi:Protein of unknown function (DUF2971)